MTLEEFDAMTWSEQQELADKMLEIATEENRNGRTSPSYRYTLMDEDWLEGFLYGYREALK